MNENNFSVAAHGEWFNGSFNDFEISQLKEQVAALKAQIDTLKAQIDTLTHPSGRVEHLLEVEK